MNHADMIPALITEGIITLAAITVIMIVVTNILITVVAITGEDRKVILTGDVATTCLSKVTGKEVLTNLNSPKTDHKAVLINPRETGHKVAVLISRNKIVNHSKTANLHKMAVDVVATGAVVNNVLLKVNHKAVYTV